MARNLPMPEPPIGGQKKMQERRKAASKKKGAGAALGGISGGLFGGLIQQPAKQAGSLAEAIERQAANLKAKAAGGADSGMANPFQMLQDQLFGAVNSIGVAPTPIEELRRIAEQQISAQFDPVMNALKREMDQRADRGNRSMRTARDMYNGLSKDYISQLPELTQQFAAEDAATNQRYDDAQAQLKAEYNQDSGEQNALMQQLGIQAAAPDASQRAAEDQAYFQNQFELSQQQDLSALNEQQMAQQDYTRNLGNNARMAGENLAQDIGQQLQDFMDQASGQMTDLRGQRGSALSALIGQMQQQDAERVAQQRQAEFDNMLKLFNFQLDATNSMVKNQGQAGGGFGAEGTLTTGTPGAENYLASMYPNQPILASNLMEQIQDVLANKQVKQGKFILDPGDPAMGKSPKYSDVGQQMIEALLRDEFRKEGDRYNASDINNTMAALQAYLGKLR